MKAGSLARLIVVIAVLGGVVESAIAGASVVAPPPLVQQGSKLVGDGERGSGAFGYAVAVSADGKTALIGAPANNGEEGAVWVFTRSGSTWHQQAAKLTGSDEHGKSQFGFRLALSADGNTALIAGPLDDNKTGAAWVFVRSGSSWKQQGSKLVGTNGRGHPLLGFSVALSADGNTALIGGPLDNDNAGAAWTFNRSGRTWKQQTTKMTGRCEIGFGETAALSATGKTALIGCSGDRGGQGTVWAFTRSGTS